MSENTPKLGHLRALAVQCKSLIASVASAAADAIGEVAAAKADKAEFIATSLAAENWPRTLILKLRQRDMPTAMRSRWQRQRQRIAQTALLPNRTYQLLLPAACARPQMLRMA